MSIWGYFTFLEPNYTIKFGFSLFSMPLHTLSLANLWPCPEKLRKSTCFYALVIQTGASNETEAVPSPWLGAVKELK
jgi:hypothetical protein